LPFWLTGAGRGTYSKTLAGIEQARKEDMKFLTQAALLVFVVAAPAWGQPAWRPEKQVEIILPTAPGGGNDTVARLMQKMLQDQKLVQRPILVANKAGGNQTVSVAYHAQHRADPHYLLFATSTLLTNHIQGLTQYSYRDFPALALRSAE